MIKVLNWIFFFFAKEQTPAYMLHAAFSAHVCDISQLRYCAADH